MCWWTRRKILTTSCFSSRRRVERERSHTPGEPPGVAVGRIREQLPIVLSHEASVLANRELFGRLATSAMLPSMEADTPVLAARPSAARSLRVRLGRGGPAFRDPDCANRDWP